MQKLLFEAFALSEEVRRAVEDMGFETATPIQSLAIPAALEGHDIIGQAQTGTGKTAAFGIPLLEKLEPKNRATQALVLCPTRELAIQVAEEIRLLAAHKRGVGIVPVYGGQPIERQFMALKKGAQVVVGTPGRIIDHIDRGTLHLEKVRTLVLDEADEMLDMGFIEDIERILQAVPEERQTLLFSATMPKPILEITRRYQREPKHLSVVHEKLTVPSIDQAYIELRENQKVEALSRMLDVLNPELTLVFCNTKKGVDELVAALRTRGYQAEALHGDLKQMQRDRVMNRFRKGSVDIMVATDVAARGIDVEDIGVVFNYDIPWDEEDYVHRIGRTARAGKSGRAVSFVTGRDIRKLRDIQRFTGTRIRRERVPSVTDVEESRTSSFLEKVRAVLDDGVSERHVRIAERLMEADVPSIEVAAALIRMILGADETPEHKEMDFSEVDENAAHETMVLAVGRKHGVAPGDIVGAIAGECSIPGKAIGAIRIRDWDTLVDVPAVRVDEIAEIMSRVRIRGQLAHMRRAEPDDRREEKRPPFRKGGKPWAGDQAKPGKYGGFGKKVKKKGWNK